MEALANLPSETATFLRAGEQLEYDRRRCEPGVVTLKSLDQLTKGEVWVHTDLEGDPHFGEDGYYAVPALSLTGECEAYDPEFILLWLPVKKSFGTWDCDHWVLSKFPNATWRDIVADPARYLNTQWDASSGIAEVVKPWLQHEFRLGRPF